MREGPLRRKRALHVCPVRGRGEAGEQRGRGEAGEQRGRGRQEGRGKEREEEEYKNEYTLDKMSSSRAVQVPSYQ